MCVSTDFLNLWVITYNELCSTYFDIYFQKLHPPPLLPPQQRILKSHLPGK